jgi:hypothetical protein
MSLHLGERGVEHARCRVTDDVSRDDRCGGVAQDSLEVAGRRLLECAVDLVHRRRFGEADGEVGE